MLTLGILIVAGGTLAALPFRIRKSPVDASLGSVPTVGAIQTSRPVRANDAAQATGPVVSDSHSPVDWLTIHPAGQRSPTDMATLERSVAFERPPQAPQPKLTSSPSSRPLTYADLVVPVTQSGILQERFNAVAGKRPSTRPRTPTPAPARQPLAGKAGQDDHLAASTQSQSAILPDEWTNSFQPFSFADTQPTERPVLPAEPRHDRVHQPSDTSLVSAPLATPTLPPNVRSTSQPAPARQRHWIRQP